jgi:hypothetical protein
MLCLLLNGAIEQLNQSLVLGNVFFNYVPNFSIGGGGSAVLCTTTVIVPCVGGYKAS